MALPLPNLDDRRFHDLLAEARALIPAHAPQWTNHNASDPGITLVELFAWLAEMLVFRANQVPDAHRVAFLRLLNGPEWEPGRDLEDDTRATLLELRALRRAVTCDDFERLALATSTNIARVRCVARRNLRTGREADSPGEVSVIVVPRTGPSILTFDGRRFRDVTARARSGAGPPFALAGDVGRYLYVGAPEPFDAVDFGLRKPGEGYALEVAYWDGGAWSALTAEAHDLVDGTAGWSRDGAIELTPPRGWAETDVAGASRLWLRIGTAAKPVTVAEALEVVPRDRLLTRVWDRLERARILGTAHHVVEPEYVPVGAELLVARREDVPEADVRAAIVAALEAFLDPLTGGPAGMGWPFGRDVYVSEVHEVLRRVPGVDHVPDLRLLPGPTTTWLQAVDVRHDSGDQIGLALGPHRLPAADLDPARIVMTTRFLPVRVRVRATVGEAASRAGVASAAKDALRAFFHPLAEREDDHPLATLPADVGTDELRPALRAALAGLAEVTAIELETERARLSYDPVRDVTSVHVAEGELVDLDVVLDLAA